MNLQPPREVFLQTQVALNNLYQALTADFPKFLLTLLLPLMEQHSSSSYSCSQHRHRSTLGFDLQQFDDLALLPIQQILAPFNLKPTPLQLSQLLISHINWK